MQPTSSPQFSQSSATPDVINHNRATLAVVLIVKNEGAHLAACLEKIKDLADEIIILDSGSTDDTEAVARRYTNKFFVNTPWPGFGKQRQIAQQYVTADWVLWLDADEHVTPALAQSIHAILSKPPSGVIFKITRLSWAFDRFIHHSGWYPGYVERLYPTQLTCYNDSLVHERVVIPNGVQVKALKGDLLHYTYQDLGDFLTKSDAYSLAWAKQKYLQGKKSSLSKAVLHGVARFFTTYVIKAGFLDGKTGFLLAMLNMQAVFNKYAILWQLCKTASQGKQTLRADQINNEASSVTDSSTSSPNKTAEK